jgi:hypothetical protein
MSMSATAGGWLGFIIGGLTPLGPLGAGIGAAIGAKVGGDNEIRDAQQQENTQRLNAERWKAVDQENTLAQEHISDNNVLVAQSQAAVMELGVLESSKASQFQTLAWLTERLDSNDTKLQVAVINAKKGFASESDRHLERMEELRLDHRRHAMMISGGAGSPDIPEPTF